MKAFEWTNPASVNEAVKMLTVSAPGDIDEAPRPIAGGQDLLTTMKDYTSRPVRVVNLKNIPRLDRITLNARGLTIGALDTLTELEEHAGVRKSFPGLAEAAHSIATPQIRNLGTVGGNLCQRPRCWYFRLEEVICLKKGGSECYAASGEQVQRDHRWWSIVHRSSFRPCADVARAWCVGDCCRRSGQARDSLG